MSLHDLVSQHSAIARELVSAIRELGDVRSKIITDESMAWLHAADFGVTERRESVKHAIASLRAEEVNQVAEVEALRVQLDACKMEIEYARGIA